MFEVERSTLRGISVRDDGGHLWMFIVDDDDEQVRTLSVSAIVANPMAGTSPHDRAAKAQSFAEMEAWKRGLID